MLQQITTERGGRLAGQLVAMICLCSGGNAGDVVFRRHAISMESEYSAVAAFDVNHDGRCDILCGGFWYEAPHWRRHFVRDVERIRGRFDGYAHLPLDVNGDGWTDVITVNYRSRSIKWMEHPGGGLERWTTHTVAEPGAMETGRLVDVDGDGRLDIFPNGQRFSAWWELQPGAMPRWSRHALPSELAGHGMGFGDIDGDGRGDVIGPTGWGKCPKDPRKDRWVWHSEFELGRASVPVLVVDVDEDGDNDLVWSRAHGFGVYWMEQRIGSHGREWIHHTIDTSWSQCHSPLWADMDGDGKSELVLGKRYMSHEGRDPGAYDPLVSYRYQFNGSMQTWRRWPISEGEQVGFGLDPKVIDLDADGDLDLVVCGRSGLYWLENEGRIETPRHRPTASVYANHTDLAVVADSQGTVSRLESRFDLGIRRSHILQSIQDELGTLPGAVSRVPLDVRVIDERKVDELTVRRISFQTTSRRRLEAELWIPKASSSKAPGLILVYGHSGNSLTTYSDRAGELAGRGCVCITLKLSRVDHDRDETASPLLGESRISHVWDCVRAADVLESLPQVNRIDLGCVGWETASPIALLSAAFDQRIKVTLCDGFSISDVHPKLNAFSLVEVLAAISPRSILLRPSTLRGDESTAALQQAVSDSSPAFELHDQSAPVIHASDDTEQARLRAYAWLEGKL